MDTKEYVTTGEAARLLGVGLNTIKRWIASGDIKGMQTPGGHWRIPKSSLLAFMKKHGMPVLETGNPRVLIVDDEPAVCELSKAIIEEHYPSIEIKSVYDGYAGLIQIGLWRPDILLLDVFMPGIDGVEVLRRLREDHESLGQMGIIVVTAAYDRPHIQSMLEEVKPDALLPKPIHAQSLLDSIQECLINKKLLRHVA